MQPLVSVVIPAYNAESTIESTLKAVINQNYSNIEVVVVNDCSTDATAEVARKTLEKGNRPYTVVDHEVNKGECGSRNTGMDTARGEFVWFIDSDDLAENNLVSELLERITANESDLSFCGYKIMDDISGTETLYPVKLNPDKNYSAADITCKRILRKISPSICSVMFRKQFFNSTGLRFSEGCTAGGDVEFQIKAFSMARTLSFTTAPLFIYRIHTKMGSVKDADTFEKRLKRYSDNTDAHFRTADFVMNNSAYQTTRDLAKYLILPQSYGRMLKICAMQGDRARFEMLLESPEIRSILWSSRKSFVNKPEVFLKAICLLLMPGLFYKFVNKT